MDVSTSIQHRLLDAQNEFLAALNAGDDALNAFSEKWSCLREDVEQAVGRSALDQDVLSLAHSVSSRIAVLSESVAQLDQDANRITSSLLEDVEDIFAQMTLDDTIPRTFDRPTPIRTHKLERSVRASLPQYLPAAYEWLFLHLHDPYPSAILKRQLAKECHVSLRCIDDWFKSIRRRMGWVSLCKTHFKGSRSLAIVAAKRTFLEESVGADLPFEVVADFLAMKSRLQNLYIAEQGSNAHTSLPHQTRRKRQRSSSSLSVDSPIVISPSSPSYAFEDDIQLVGDLQDRSPGRPPSLVFSSSDSDEDDAGSDFVSQTPPDDKIIWSDDSTSSWDVVDKVQDNTPRYVPTEHCISWPDFFFLSSIFFARLQKAHEPGMSPTPGCSLERCLPLPVSGLDWWSSQMEANHPVVSPETLPPAPSCIPPKCRKRRRSDADGYPLPKRSRNGPAMRASRPQAVSNPFPVKQNVAQDLPVVGYENFFKDIDSILSMAPDPQPAVDLDEFVDFDAYCHTFSPEADIRPAGTLFLLR